MLLIYTAIEDIARRKIRNLWVVAIFLLSLLMAWQRGGVEEWLLYMGKCVMWALLPFALYRFRLLGAGDVKLLSVVAAGIQGEQIPCFWGGMLGSVAVMAIWKVVTRRSGKDTVPLAVAICVGYGMVMLAEKGGWL